MLNKLYKEMEKLTSHTAWERGRTAAVNGRVIHCTSESEIRRKQAVTVITGIVNDFPNRMTEIVYKTGTEKLVECKCSCNHDVSKKNICEHLSALIHKYTEIGLKEENAVERDILSVAENREDLINSIVNPKDKTRYNIVAYIRRDICPISKNITLALEYIKLGNDEMKYYDITHELENFEKEYKFKDVLFGKTRVFNPTVCTLTPQAAQFLSLLKEIRIFFESKADLFITSSRIIIPHILIERFIDTIRMLALNIDEPPRRPEVFIDCSEDKNIIVNTSRLDNWYDLGLRFLIRESDDGGIAFLEIGENGVRNFKTIKSLAKNHEAFFGELKEQTEGLIAKLKECFTVIETDTFLKGFYHTKEDMKAGLLVEVGEKGELLLIPEVIYNGEMRKNIFLKDIKVDVLNPAYKRVKDLPGCFPVTDNDGNIHFEMTHKQAIFNFMTYYYEEIKELMPLVYGDKIKNLKYCKTDINIKINMDTLLKFSFDAAGLEKEEIAEIFEKLNEQSGDYIMLDDFSIIEIDRQHVSDIQKYIVGLGITKEEFLNEVIIRNNHYKYFLGNRDFLEYKEELETSYPDIMKDYPTIREYQKEGIKWFLSLKMNNVGGILADDMGLGKTLQCLIFLRIYMSYIKPDSINMIIVPKSLLNNWLEEINKFAPNFKIKVIQGIVSERTAAIKNINPGELVITSYSIFAKDYAGYKKIFFDNIVFDEAHQIKNNKTGIFKTVKSLKAGNMFLLSGTPIENHIKEIWSLFDIMMPSYLGTLARFLKMFKQAENMEVLKSLVRPFILRRLKEDVEEQLPKKLEKDLIVDLEDEQKICYLNILEQIKNDIKLTDKAGKGKTILYYINRLRQICTFPEVYMEGYKGPNAKIELLQELLEEHITNGHKILIFSQFTSGLLSLKNILSEKYKTAILHGRMTIEERMKEVNEFKKPETNIFLIAMKVGGYGLNLTEADIVIHLDPWWNQSVENQATDRTHRIGQNKSVFVTNLIAKGTIEEKIREVKREKTEIIDNLLRGEYIDFSKLDKKLLVKLIGPDIQIF